MIILNEDNSIKDVYMNQLSDHKWVIKEKHFGLYSAIIVAVVLLTLFWRLV